MSAESRLERPSAEVRSLVRLKLPLIRSILEEIRERSRELVLLEATLCIEPAPSGVPALARRRCRELELAEQRRQLDRALTELARQGCGVWSWNPLSLAFEVHVDGKVRRVLWLDA